jgi:hypothetical protein
VRGGVRQVTVDGRPAEYKLTAAVGLARLLIEAPAAREHRFEVALEGGPVEVEGPLRAVVGRKAVFRVRGGKVGEVLYPQGTLAGPAAVQAGDEGTEVAIIPARPGKPTVFLEVHARGASWFHPLDLDVHQPWTIVERCIPALNNGGPAVASPAIDVKTKTLALELAAGGPTDLDGRAQITVAGRTFEQEARPGAAPLRVSLEPIWDRLSPGSVPVTVELNGRTETKEAIAWDIGKQPGVAGRMRPLDLSRHYNSAMDKLFSPATQWRIDYTGAQHGVDRRHPMPLRDERGYVIMNSVLSVFEYGTLPEQVPALKRIKFSKLEGPIEAGVGVPFQTKANRILAICCTQPYEQFPGRVTIKLPEPRRAEKLYLLTGNLVKTLKCYYPGAEITVRYADGSKQLHQMIPPYTMPSIVGHICPRARAVRVGTLEGGGNPVVDTAAYLSVTDVVLDPSKPAAAIELRCVATETLLGVAGMTLLEAR